MTQRHAFLQQIADLILKQPAQGILRVAIDGVDGAGKTRFADELAPLLGRQGRPIIRAGVDGFHHPRSTRHQRGRGSPEGFFRDSYNYAALKEMLLDPLSPGGSGRYRTAVFDHTTDSFVSRPSETAAPGSILLFDGIFLHRPELRDYWDFSIFLRADFGVSIARCAQRDPNSASPDPQAEENRRYVEGQKLYLAECQPEKHATIVIDNNDLTAPFIVP